MSATSQAKLSPRATRTRSALISAGFELLVERPIEAISIDELVANAHVAKGSFFNHFRDKQDFAAAIARQVRREVECLVEESNAGIVDPVARLVGGMNVAAQFAISQPKRSAVLLRSHGGSTARDHPLNKGLREDIEAACRQGMVRNEVRIAGVAYWLGLCQCLMMTLLENAANKPADQSFVEEMIVLGLCGLGVDEDKARTYLPCP